MARRLSVLFVGTSATRGSAAERTLRSQGFDVDFDMPFAHKGGFLPLVSGHDLIALDAPGAAPDLPGLILLGGRGSQSLQGYIPAALTDEKGFAAAVAQVLASSEERPDKASQAGTGNRDTLGEMIASLPGVVFRCDIGTGGEVEYISDQIRTLCGYETSHFAGQEAAKLWSLVHVDDRKGFAGALRRAARQNRDFTRELRIICAGNQEKWAWFRGSVRECKHSGRKLLEGFAVDVTDRKLEQQQLAFLANHDALTGLANRALFLEQMGASLQRADRHGEMVACLFVDLDRFKRVNDSFGHAFGDELLRQVAMRLKRCVRGNDLIGRLGGDEFTVLLDGIDEPLDAAAAAQKILDELSEPFRIHSRQVSIAASIGISCYPGDAADHASLLRNSDAAMYDVKRAGRRAYRFYSASMSSQAFEILALTAGLRHAIENGELDVHYQPRVNLKTGRIIGLEALARWNSNEFGQVSPSRFIPLAEDIGLIGQLGEFILRAACAQAVAWDKLGLPATRLAVNLSPRQFRDEHLPEQIMAILSETGVAPQRLELEITESTMMQDHVSAAEVLGRLRDLGIHLAVDDFGTGYSSLHILKKLPLHYLKVDRAFIGGVPGDEDDVAITEAIIAMARRLNLRVVAEGIETEAQGVFVRSSGCDEGQGYLFSRPMPAGDIGDFLRRRLH